jgi:hypothetical protein
VDDGKALEKIKHVAKTVVVRFSSNSLTAAKELRINFTKCQGFNLLSPSHPLIMKLVLASLGQAMSPTTMLVPSSRTSCNLPSELILCNRNMGSVVDGIVLKIILQIVLSHGNVVDE